MCAQGEYAEIHALGINFHRRPKDTDISFPTQPGCVSAAGHTHWCGQDQHCLLLAADASICDGESAVAPLASLCACCSTFFLLWRRIAPPRMSNPDPKSTRDAGSGVGLRLPWLLPPSAGSPKCRTSMGGAGNGRCCPALAPSAKEVVQSEMDEIKTRCLQLTMQSPLLIQVLWSDEMTSGSYRRGETPAMRCVAELLEGKDLRITSRESLTL